MKRYDVCGIGNALVDLLFECSDLQFKSLGMTKGGMRLVDNDTQLSLLNVLERPVRRASGGSVANSVALVGQLGGRGALQCVIADDELGRFFAEDLRQFSVDCSAPKGSNSTGTSFVVVTPDAERSMSTNLGACTGLSAEHLDGSWISDSKWLFIEGYVIANSAEAREAIATAVAAAKKSGTKVALTLSDAFVVNGFRDFLTELLPQIDLLFANEVEAAALSGVPQVEGAFDSLRKDLPAIVVTAGPDGAYVSMNGHVGHVAAYPCDPVDLTGAGDAFAGAFVSGITSGLTPFDAAKKGCFFAGEVIQQWGARLRSSVPELLAKFQQHLS